MRKRFFVFALIVAVLLHTSMIGYAYKESGQWVVTAQASNLPADTVRLDLLLKIDTQDQNYRACNTGDGIDETAAIVQYAQDGYRSYLYHFADAQGETTKDAGGWFSAAFGRENDANKTLRAYAQDVKVAALNADGEILLISDPFSYRVSSSVKLWSPAEFDGKTVTQSSQWNYIVLIGGYVLLVVVIVAVIAGVTVALRKRKKT